MSYMRYGHTFRFFKTGETKYYVFLSPKGMIDCGEDYNDDKSTVELIGRIILHETKDIDYTWKIVQMLALRFGVSDDLRDAPLTSDEYFSAIVGEVSRREKPPIPGPLDEHPGAKAGRELREAMIADIEEDETR